MKTLIRKGQSGAFVDEKICQTGNNAHSLTASSSTFSVVADAGDSTMGLGQPASGSEALDSAVIDPAAVWALIKSRSAAQGLALVGAAPAAAVSQHALFSAWLDAELHGELYYLGRPDDREARRDPQ